MKFKWSKEKMEAVINKYENYSGDKSDFYLEENITKGQFYAMKNRYKLKYVNSEKLSQLKLYPRNLLSIVPLDNRLTLEINNNCKAKGSVDDIFKLIVQLKLI